MMQLLGLVQLIVAIALMGLLAQGALYVLAGQRREQNVFYNIVRIVPSPFVKLFRLITPKRVEDRLVPFAAFCGLSALFIWLAFLIPQLR
ncbi:MAG: hypothetical protein JNN20_05030 [Betaproteobacteria bacterium]|nr:hypothetical protein [Betaproteobacteria bacterium]